MKNEKTLMLVEGAVMVALAFALSYVRVFTLPQGGSITLLSLLPVSVYGIRNGWKAGLGAGFVLSLFMFFQGITEGLFAWGLTPKMLVVCIVLDYFLAYTITGLGALFGGKTPAKQALAIAALLFAKFICHFVSGVICFGEFASQWGEFFARHKVLYSLCYNGAHMIPELLITTAAAYVVLKNPTVSKKLARAK